MKKHTAALAASILACGALTAATRAQQTPPPGGGAGGAGGFNMRRLPIALGQVTAINAAAGTITITSQLGGDSQTIQVSGTTTINTQTDAAIADLKVGDQVSVSGVPTTLTASQITIGQMPGMMGGRGQGAGGAQGGGAGGAARAGGPGAGPGGAQASGKVTSLNPLVISLGPDAMLTLKMAPNARVSKISAMPLSGLKVGDRVMASGQAGADGVFAATSLGVNMPMGGGMMGGFGGMRGMRGTNGQGGFGGANGQRRQRRNQNGAPGGVPEAPPPADPNANPPQ